jgi:hypothetical protein
MLSRYSVQDISGLLGETLERVEGAEEGSGEIVFVTVEGRKYRMYHDQECCESVYVEDVCGDVGDLLGCPIEVAEESTNDKEGSDEWEDQAQQWTFYKLVTVKGHVTIRWYGRSNGYYSTSVSFERV